ncbi:MAG: type II toxin-antitoxin system PemK/MazF family toxin [bacterium]|nr:type II toxin-antitoxin system PemK/MazF family toxin [bacterium]
MIKQGSIYLTDLSPTKGHEQSEFRRVLVVQKNILNQFLSTVIIAPLTTNMTTQGKLTTYFLSKEKTKIDKDSVALIYQMRTVDKNRLKKQIGQIMPSEIEEIKKVIHVLF